jgi:hypothetical protein
MESKVIKCSRCETENQDYSKYCRGCGYELPKVVAEKTVTAPLVKSARKISVGLTVGLTIAGVFIGFVLGLLVGIISTYSYVSAVPAL